MWLLEFDYMRIVTITDEHSIILTEFKLTDKDANKMCDSYDTSWMDDDDLKVYFKDELP
jgi:hypothetical protein